MVLTWRLVKSFGKWTNGIIINVLAINITVCPIVIS